MKLANLVIPLARNAKMLLTAAPVPRLMTGILWVNFAKPIVVQDFTMVVMELASLVTPLARNATTQLTAAPVSRLMTGILWVNFAKPTAALDFT